jgi:hypothetical protein
MLDPDQRARTYAILGGFLCLLLLNNALWLHLDSTPLTMDEADHFANSVSYYLWLWRSTPPEQLSFYELLPYPPLVGLLTHLIYPLFGFNAHAAIFFIQSVFSILLMFALYGLSNFFCRERETGIVASLLMFLYPVTFVAARHYLLDLPLAALSALSMYALFRWHRNPSRRAALLLGLLLGLGMLVKWSFVFYLTLPTLLVLLRLSRSQSSRQALAHLAWIALPALLVTLPWYAPRLRSDWAMVRTRYMLVQSPTDPVWTTWPGLLYYGIDFVRSEASPLGAAFFLLGAAFFLKKRMSFERYLLLAWVVPAVILLTFFRYKVPRYALPYLPAVALITMAGVSEIKRKALRSGLLIGFITLLVIQYYVLSFSASVRPRLGGLSLFRPESIEFFSTYPRKGNWKLDEIMKQLTEAFKRFPDKKRVVYVLGSHEIYNATVFNYLSTVRRLGIRFIGAQYAVDPTQVLVNEASYVLFMECPPDANVDIDPRRVAQVADMVRSQPSRYTPLWSVYLPDGSLMTIYSKL